MAVVAVLIPMAMLVVMLALGRYEELMLPSAAEEPEARRSGPAPQPGTAPARDRTAPARARRPARPAVRLAAGPRPVGAPDHAHQA